ncbi:helix-turn-helix transcriptional regulator [Amphiplicatus metriothermophilus]|uniref:DNA-binding transcriptional regulator, XRE-family HTH domain n=1 Tax=Amphiplicatus metriothermophilus TaxID=1519374 RepID=A0A239PTU5_9PROT|nr:helix-turn-helix transcriptional regulator [Amphiplicatus metriothermophilus]MBB5519263.1 transcriptional regulator with XRE-family HTH domain [Amphiplicatus metriothermophilus]SNT73332.1 DNA-binding transcriptional regulator, XRE-family HTH domain [Amphiplicatus metriothermophilus]
MSDPNATPRDLFGARLKAWRARRRKTQLDLALEAGISQKHLSFVETGRALPSREMVVLLCASLDIPLRERNAMLAAAGYAPLYRARPLDDPSLRPAVEAVRLLLDGHMPYPALAVDRGWNMLAANDAALALAQGAADPSLLDPPANVLRLSLHPNGLAPHILNLSQWRVHVLARLRRQIEATGDRDLETLYAELSGFPAPERAEAEEFNGVFTPLTLRAGESVLSLFSATTVFGSPTDVTLSELAIESFFPADDATRALLSGARFEAARPLSRSPRESKRNAP